MIYQSEVAFEKKYSFDNKSILVRHVVGNFLLNLAQKQCTKECQLSVVMHSPSNEEKFLEIGYEVFFERTQSFDVVKFKESIYDDFQSISKPKIPTEKNDETEAGLIMRKEIVKDLWENEITKFEVNMGYVWLSKIVIRFDFSALSLKSVTYFMYETVDSTAMEVKCKDSDLGISVYGRTKSPRYFYKEDKQSQIFNSVYPGPSNHDCLYYKVCVEQYNLVPAYQFQSLYSSSVSCSQLTTIPLWIGSIKNVLDYFEKFLVALAQVANSKLKITAGVREIMSLSSLYSYTPGLASIYIHYSTKNKKHYPAPKIIYKIVSYQSLECQGGEDTCWFDMAIVFHNEPIRSKDDTDSKDYKICKDKCSSWGFDSIQYLSTTEKKTGNESELVYCCELDDEMRALLGHPKGQDLDLKNFPYYNQVDKKIHVRNIQKDVEKKMRNLFGL